ncbi:hypothetical protein P7C71_g5264, partial [Lecanoromycetidae sp. Uapishka_2]
MASLRRTRTMPTDGAISKFLYTIMKQLDLKSIDWQEVANQLDITNGHAARMRYSRFKSQMEGTPTQTRKPRVTGPRQKKAKLDQASVAERTQAEQQRPSLETENAINDEGEIKGQQMVKAEPGTEEGSMEGIVPTYVKPEPVIKEEPRDAEEASWPVVGMGFGAVGSDTANEGQQVSENIRTNEGAAHQSSPAAPAAEEEQAVKVESF